MPKGIMGLTKAGMILPALLVALLAHAAVADDFVAGEDMTPQTISESPVPMDLAAVPSSSNLGGDGLANFGPSSGTLVGKRAVALRDDVARLRASVNLNSSEFSILHTGGAAGAVQYHSTVAAIIARLQNGTTRGNPILLRQWQEADSSLSEVTSSLNKLNSLQVSINADASVASYLLDSVQAAFDLSGAVDEDHDQLKLLRDEVTRLVTQLEYLHTQTTSDIERQSAYLGTERANLQSLAYAISRGELIGNSLANRPVIVNTPSVAAMPVTRSNDLPPPAPSGLHTQSPTSAPVTPVIQQAPTALPPLVSTPTAPPQTLSLPPKSVAQLTNADSDQTPSSPRSAEEPNPLGRLLVLVRFDEPNVEYQKQMTEAVAAALDHRPEAVFSVIAVAPASGDPASLVRKQETARTKSEEMKRVLMQMGLPPSRISLTNTQSKDVQVPEVHLYVR